MRTWIELESRFRKISESCSSLRLDLQWGVTGEHFGVRVAPRDTVEEFNGVSAIAGRLLATQLDPFSRVARLVAKDGPKEYVWYRALKELTSAFEHFAPATQLDDDKDVVGHIFMAHLNNAALVSANLCLRLHDQYPEETSTMPNVSVNITNSSIGLQNTGEIEEVESISVNVTTLKNSGQERIAEALESMSRAIVSSDQLNEQHRTDLLECVEELSKQATLRSDERAKRGVVKATVDALAQGLSSAGGLAEVWSTWGKTISTFFGL